MSFSLKQIRHFLAAAEAGQISRAAVEFNLSQSAMTASLQHLEALLGLPLFERRPNGVALTSAGTRFLPHARSIVSACNDALRMPGGAPRAVKGRVAVAVTYTVAGYYMTNALSRFRRLFPEIEIVLREAERSAIEADIACGSGEVGLLLTSNVADTNALTCRTLIRSTRRVWAPSDHPLLGRGRVGLAEVAEFPYVALTVDEGFKTTSRYWGATPHRPNIMFKTASVEAVRTMVASGLGITILSDMVYRPWSLDGQRIETCDLSDDVPTMDVGLVWKRDSALTPAAETLVNHLLGVFPATEPPMHDVMHRFRQ